MIIGQSGSGEEVNKDFEPVHVDVKQHLESLERQVEELMRMQQQTMHTLQYMTRHLQAKKIEAVTPKKGWL
jgi:chaperonin cofactor prefoldin